MCLVTVVDDLIRMGGSEQSDIRLFLDALDVRSDSWKDEAERWILERIQSSQRRKRVPRFSIGDVDELSENEAAVTVDASTQTSDGEKPEVESAPSKSLDEISRDWSEGRPLAASDALRLVKRGIVKCRELSRVSTQRPLFS